MEDFKIIETQEQLDAVIKGRLERAEKKHSEATAELQSEIEALKTTNTELTERIQAYDDKYAGYDDKIAELQNKVKGYETDSVKSRICNEMGIPLEMKDRLRGESEEEIKADAEALNRILPKSKSILKSTEVIPAEDDNTKALRDMLKSM